MLRLTILLLLISSAANANINAGINALKNSDYGGAFQIFQPMAVEGNAEAQFQMCGLYFNGLGVPRSAFEAKQWCEKAANQGHREAAYNVGLMFFNGEGTAQNYKQAEYWFKSAANKGHKDAEYNLIQIYNANRIADERLVGRKLIEEAQLQQRLAATANQNPALAPQQKTAALIKSPPLPNLAPINTANIAPVPQVNIAPNPVAAPRYIPQARIPDVQLSQNQLAELEAEKNCLQAIRQGIVPDNCYEDEAPIAANPAELYNDFDWLTKSASEGNVQAMNNLAIKYRRGKGVKKNPEKAFELFQKAANKGSSNAMLNLASMYKNGEGVAANPELAYSWYNLSADRLTDAKLQADARGNIKELSANLSNEQIGNALEHVNKLDQNTPIIQ